MSTFNHSDLSADLKTAEAAVQTHSSAFKKELGIVDLLFAHILFMMNPQLVGTAGKLGDTHFVFWALTIIFFFIPLVKVVSYLNRLLALEGGLYQWVKFSFNEKLGFLVAWNIWFCIVLSVSQIGLYISSFLAYSFASFSWISESKLFLIFANSLAITILIIISIIGFKIGKWLHNLSGMINILIFLALISLPLINISAGNLATYKTPTITLPTLSLLSINIFSKMAFTAFCGFEYISIFAGECRNPRNISRAALFSIPIVVTFYILGTHSLLNFVKPDDIDLLGVIPQAFSLGTQNFGIAKLVTSVCCLGLSIGLIAIGNLSFNGNARLPMVAGWDKLVPDWVTKLHPKYKTPIYSILFVGAVTLTMAIASTIGVGNQEAYQLLQSAGGVCYGLAYLVMFAIPIWGYKKLGSHPSISLRLASLSGFIVTLLYIILSVFPIIEVASWKLFAAKIILTIFIINLLGSLIVLFAKSSTALHNISKRP
ncbi:MAG: hypothetical protein FD167_15 [bacterium]|nr:MAG: hypothetical protein FD167_15 [bacterium]